MADKWASSAILAFDSADDARSTGTMHTRNFVPGYSLNEGIDHLAQKELAQVYATSNPALAAQYNAGTRHVFGGYRNYGVMPPAFDPAGQPGTTAFLLGFGGAYRRVLCTHWVYGTTDVERAREATLDAILAGQYDQTMRTFVGSLPIGRNAVDPTRPWQFRIPIMGEVDVITPAAFLATGGVGKEPVALRDKARAAVLYQINVLTRAALDLGASPSEFGVGGLCTRWTMDSIANPTHSGYDWWRDTLTAIPDPAQRAMIVGFVNPYFYHLPDGTPEDPRATMRMHKAMFTDVGINRYLVSETTCGLGTRKDHMTPVGSAAGQAQFIDWVVELVDEGTVEWLSYFHAPGGYMSDQAPLRGLPLRRLALAAERINLR